ncbi:MAG TPA: hypothetical protein VL122_09055, partial [Nitrospirota bacterium]|nr:hypothetical protein [Nitrospirota bacterium]
MFTQSIFRAGTNKRTTRRVGTKTHGMALVLLACVVILLCAFPGSVAACQTSIPPGQINKLAGTGDDAYSGDGAPAAHACVNNPSQVTVDSYNNIYVADTNNNCVRMIDPAGNITTVAGTCNPGEGQAGDGGSLSGLKKPTSVTVDMNGNIYISDSGNNVIKRIDCTKVVTVIAGNGHPGYSGDGGQATSATFKLPSYIYLDKSGNMYVADSGNNVVRRIDANGIVTTIAGEASNKPGYYGDGGPATKASLNNPTGVAVDANGLVYIADSGNNCVRMVDAKGTITTIAGNGNAGSSGDGGAAVSAKLHDPTSVSVDPSGNLIITDSGNNKIREISAATGIIKTIVGTGNAGDVADGIEAIVANLRNPSGCYVDTDGSIYIADTGNNKVLKVQGNGNVFTISASSSSNGCLSPSCSKTSGCISPSRDLTIPKGKNSLFTITPSQGYRIEDVLVDGASVGAVSSYTFYNVISDHTIAVSFTLDTYTITATISNIDSSTPVNGTISPAGTTIVDKGGNITYTISPSPNSLVSGLVVDGTQQGKLSKYTFSNVSANHTIAASVQLKTTTVTASAGAGGTISNIGSNTVSFGDSMSFTITANPGYSVSDVLVDGVSVGAVTSYSFTNVTAIHTIKALFTPNAAFTINASSTGNGTMTPTGSVAVNGGASKTFTFIPAKGYRVDSVLIDGANAGITTTSYTFVNVQANHSIVVSFVPDVYTITASIVLGNGTITPAGVTTVNDGGSQSYTVTAAAGYSTSLVRVNGVAVTLDANNSYTITNVTANATITAVFVPITYTVTVTQTANGTIAPGTLSGITPGANQVIAITPNAGYHVAGVTVDGSSVGAVTSYTLSNIQANHTVTATFAANPSYTITATAGTNGSISSAGTTTVLGGTNLTLTITPNTGYRVSSVVVDGINQGVVTSWGFANVQANHTVSATFTPDVYTITASIVLGNGTITPAGVTTVNDGGSQNYVVTPASGYYIYSVKVNGMPVTLDANSSYTVTNVTANATIAVVFEPVTYTVTVTQTANGTIAPGTLNSISPGANQTFTFTPNTGYSVSSVMVDGASVGAVTSYTLSNIQANHTV